MQIADFHKSLSAGQKSFKSTDVEALVAALLAAQPAPTAAPVIAPLGAVVVSMVDSDAVYPARFGGGKSTKVVECSVELPHAGVRVVASIYGNYTPTTDGHEIIFQANFPRGLKALDTVAKNEFLAHVELAAQRWPGWETASTAAMHRLLGTKPASAGKLVSDKPASERPRLVARIPQLTAQPTA